MEILNKMPKGAIHHIHTSAAPPVNIYLSLTYNPIVYYNEKEKIFRIYPKGESQKEDGFISCVEMRNFYKDPKEFDTHLTNEILLTEKESKGLASHDIWKYFQHKFTRVTELGKYYKFFKTLLQATIDSCIAQNVFVVELRHISGIIFDDDRKPMGLMEELKIVQECIDETKKRQPYFEMTLVITGLKIVGKPHVKKMIDHIHIGKQKYPDLISGFDMVNEEDYTAQIQEFMPQILAAQMDESSPTYNMPTFCHAGETHDKKVHNLHDAVMLNTKRIGHGFQLFLFPNLVEECIKR
jgi:adenosine deaminase CECR1